MPNVPKDVIFDKFGVIVVNEGTVEVVTTTAALVDTTGREGWNSRPLGKGLFSLIGNVLSNAAAVVPNIKGALVVTGFSLVVVIVGATLNGRLVALVDTGVSCVAGGGDDTIGVKLNNGVAIGVSLTVDTIGFVLNGEVVTGAVLLVVISFGVTGDNVLAVTPNRGKVAVVVLSLLATDNDGVGVTPNIGKVRVGGTDETFSLVIVVAGLVIGVDGFGSFTTTLGGLPNDTDSFPGVAVGSTALGFL